MSCLRRYATLCGALCASVGIASAEPQQPRERPVSVRMYDYADVAAREVAAAQQQVSGIFARVGVCTEWRTTVRPRRVAAGEAAWPSDGRAAVSVIMLNEEMARRAGVPARVAGYAAARPEIGGRVAFVLARRTQAIATRGGVPHDDVLAAVIAHELGHLLMPRRPHGRVGLMRPDWRPEEFGDAQLRAFTHEEERHLRESAERLGAYPTRAD